MHIVPIWHIVEPKPLRRIEPPYFQGHQNSAHLYQLERRRDQPTLYTDTRSCSSRPDGELMSIKLLCNSNET